jgi:hypothetical protein
MKPGDRVRVLSGEHEGRLGFITDVSARRAAVDAILKPSEIRTRLLAKLDVPQGHHAVQLDHARVRDIRVVGRADSLEVLPESILMPVTGPLASGKMELAEFLYQLEARALTAADEFAVPWARSDLDAAGHLLPMALVLALQPPVVLALIAKLRAAVRLAKDLSVEVYEFRSPPIDPAGLAHLEAQIATLDVIEVP